MRNYTKLSTGTLIYTGPVELLQFSVGNLTFEISEDHSVVQCHFKLHRNPASMIMSSYIPSFCVIVMTLWTLFLREQIHFSTTIMLVLTGLLCLYALLQNIIEEMPKTAYMKFIDYWHIIVLVEPFVIFSILMMDEIGRASKKRKTFKKFMKIFFPLLSAIFVACYFIQAAFLYSEF